MFFHDEICSLFTLFAGSDLLVWLLPLSVNCQAPPESKVKGTLALSVQGVNCDHLKLIEDFPRKLNKNFIQVFYFEIQVTC